MLSSSPLPALSHPEPSPLAPGISPLGPEDLQACFQLDQLALDGLWSEGQWLQELREPHRPVVGLWEAGRLVAVASAWLVVDELHITAVAVHPDHRRRGMGRRVLAALLETARQAGARQATLEVSRANGAARALYASLGFREVAVRRGYYRNGDDALIQYTKLGDVEKF